MKIGNGIFYHGDCLERMANIPDQSVDAIICDLPFGNVGQTAEAWDKLIPMEPLWAHYWRILKPYKPIVLFCSQPFTTKLINAQPDTFKYSLVWEKNTPAGFAHAKNMPLKIHEDILIFSNGIVGHENQTDKRIPYYPQGLQYAPAVKHNSAERYSNTAFGHRPSHKETYIQEYTNYPSTILKFDVERTEGHGTQKPVPLIEHLIRTYSAEGDTVLDNTAGSGTLAVAAERAKRKWICIEQDDTFYANATNRVKKFVGGKSEEDKDAMFF